MASTLEEAMAPFAPTVTITTHDPDCSVAIHPSSGPIQFTPVDLAGQPAAHGTFYTAHTLPVVLSDDDDIKRYAAWTAAPDCLIPQDGVIAVYDRFPPSAEVAMHRTQSLDFGVVVEGEIELLLPGGATKLLRRGDVIVQRETEHGWRNPSRENEVLIFYVALNAKPVRIGDQVLGENLKAVGLSAPLASSKMRDH
ncbi:hypothetical protein Dda_9101 [Drechslerella dactyloides]|uniref:Cupin type-2 domain-containing protein n=1 Tax=Drechslerella dactyloides TaxID=74499 RepID=A0AAD6IPY4_DREDA|nr:hypothetical protein Dda_9101 [Drechslerella dactyloides]